MRQPSNYSRRRFMEKFAAGALSLTTLASAGQDVLSSTLVSQGPQTFGGTFKSDERKFVPVMITPYSSDLKIDFGALSKLVDFYLACGSKGFFANCLSSEMYQLDADERLALARHVVKRVNGAFPVVATGSFGTTIEKQAEFARKMYDTGVNGVILITSHFATKEESDTVLINNFEKFFSLTGSIPMGTYECPSPYKRMITPDVLGFLLSTNRLVYHKDTTIDLEKIKVKIDLAKNSKLEFYDAHTPNAMSSLQMGAKGLSTIAGNFYPEIFAWMCSNANNPERKEDVLWIQSELTRADAIIGQGYPISAKYFLQKRGVSIEPLARTAKAPLTASQKQALDEIYNVLPQWHE
ncbi:MAG TPA: dihydrodipicolinate synthase family protein, partial [Chryseolinea sp.]|nr:dihydrodipicolinate synthase family protein [Chryseolinea sp.]